MFLKKSKIDIDEEIRMIRLFVCSEVNKLIDDSIKIMDKNIKNIDEESMKAEYVYIYSIFESTLTATLRYFLLAFPEKIDKNVTISKEQLLSSPLTSDVTLNVINSYIRGYSSDSLINYILFYKKTLAISIEIDDKKIRQISNIRNKIVHDDFSADRNLQYIASTGNIDLKIIDLKEGVKYLKELLSLILNEIENKYKEYTFEKLCRTIWTDTFDTPLLRFDDVWSIDEGIIHIKDLKAEKKKFKMLSRGEKTLLSIFLHQYSNTLNDQLFKFCDIAAICSLDCSSREKMINIIQLFMAHPHLFNGKKLN